jgi:hypothetical protein
MKKISSVVFLLFLTLTVFAADEPKIDFGRIDHLTYTHDYFGFHLTIPESWQVQDSESRERLMKLGKEVIVGKNENMKAMYDASEINTLNLLTIFRYPLGAAVDFNPSFVCVAEKVSHLPGIKRGSDYLFHARKLLEAGQLKYKIDDQMYSEKIGGVDFDYLNAQLDLPKIALTQKYYATIRNGYALCFVISFHTEEAAKELNGILQTVKFDSAPKVPSQ